MRGRPISERIFAWLGQYRDDLPPEAVTAMQEIADDSADRDADIKADGRTAAALIKEVIARMES